MEYIEKMIDYLSSPIVVVIYFSRFLSESDHRLTEDQGTEEHLIRLRVEDHLHMLRMFEHHVQVVRLRVDDDLDVLRMVENHMHVRVY